MKACFAIGVDRGLAHFGYAVFQILPQGEKVIEVGVVETKKSDKKKGTLASADAHRRSQELYWALNRLLGVYVLVSLGGVLRVSAAEATSLPRNASAAYKVGRAEGVWSALLSKFNLPQAEASPQAIKKCVCGRPNASKEEVAQALEKRYPGQFRAFQKAVPASKREHGYDAAAALVTCLDSEVFKTVRRMLL